MITKWVFYGDSITQGALHTFGYRDYTQLFAERVRFEMGRPHDIVINSAVSGYTSRHLLDHFNWGVEQLKPDVLLVMIGMNDASQSSQIGLKDFRENLIDLIDLVKSEEVRLVLQTTCTVLDEGSNGRCTRLASYMDIVRDMAQQHELMLIDHHRYWQSLDPDTRSYLLSDAIHPNEMGHRVLAEQLFRALNIFDESSRCCRLFTP